MGKKLVQNSGAFGGVVGAVVPIVADLIKYAYTRKRRAEVARKLAVKQKTAPSPSDKDEKKE
jgi:hypothetical protein